MRKITLSALLVFLFLVLSVGLGGCSGNSPKTSTESKQTSQPNGQAAGRNTVKFAYIVMPQAAPQALINLEAKSFENQLQKLNKQVEFTATRSLDNIWPMMDAAQGDPDFVYIPTANFSTYITETSRFGGSNKYTIIAGSINTNTTVLIAKPGVESLKDLAGKKVGVANLRYADEFQFNKMLTQVGLATKTAGGSVEVVYDDIVSKELENFKKGVYDAIIIYDPMNFKPALNSVPGSKILTTLNPDGLFGTIQPRSWLVAKKEVLKNEPELVKEVLKAHLLVTEKAEADKLTKLPTLNREVFLKYYQDKNAAMDKVMQTHTPEFYQKKWQEAEITYDPNLAYINEVFAFMQQKGVVQGKTIADFVQIQYLNEVLISLGKQPLIK